MQKISAIISNQATRQFSRKRQQIIQNTLNKHKNKANFQEILNTFTCVNNT